MEPPPAQRGRRSPPTLIDDAMSEIFLRVPADDPKTLVLAGAVCTTWRRILSDFIFIRKYREFHGAPPMLGFLHNTHHEGEWDWEGYVVSDFVSAASFRSPACQERRHCRVLDSRHGLVLFHTPKRDEHFLVCDLVTCDRWRINASHALSDTIWYNQDDLEQDSSDEDEDEDEGYAEHKGDVERMGDAEHEGVTWNAAVICAKDRCDHTYCHYGPFLVALVGSNDEEGIIFASIYSSETCKWSDMISIEEQLDIEMNGHIAVVEDKVYFQCKNSETTVEYNIGANELSLFDPPIEDDDVGLPHVKLIGVDDGRLLFVTVMGPRLYLCSMEAGPNVAQKWARRRVIEVGPLLPSRALLGVSVAGFAEGFGIIFLSTKAGLYTIELSSGRSKKVHEEKSVQKVVPYMSFYTRAWGRSPTSD